VRPAAQHGGHHLIADHERPHVGPVVVEELLQAIDVAPQLQGAEETIGAVGVADPDHALALGAEQRLDDDVPAELLERRQRVAEALCHDRARGRQAGGLEERRGVVLVDPVLDGRRRVHDPHPCLLEAAQGVHAEDHLFKRPGRDGAHEDHVLPLERDAGRAEDGVAADARRQLRHQAALGGHPASLKSPQQALGVPATPPAEDDDPHATKERRSTAAFTPPAQNVLPLRRFVIVTAAGLKSSGSIL